MKIVPYETTHVWKFPTMEIPPLKITPQNINPKKMVSYKSFPLLTPRPALINKNLIN